MIKKFQSNLFQTKLLKIVFATLIWVWALGLSFSSYAGGIAKLEGETLLCPKGSTLLQGLIENKYKSYSCLNELAAESNRTDGPFIIYYPLKKGEKIPRKKMRGVLAGGKHQGVLEQWYENGYKKSRTEFDADGDVISELNWNESGDRIYNYRDGVEKVEYSKSSQTENFSAKKIAEKIYELMGKQSESVGRPPLSDGANEVTK